MSEDQEHGDVSREKANGILKEESSPKFRLDVDKLHSLPSEQQDLFLYTFVSDFEKHVASLKEEGINGQQQELVEQVLDIVKLSSPPPTRVIRSSLGRSLAHVLNIGNRKPLYELINHLLSIINAGKGEQQLHNRHAAAFCIGEVYKSAGNGAITLASLACSSLIRLSKAAQNHAGLRAAISKALGKIIEAVGGSIDESVARDVWKHARSTASGDKAGHVQAHACWCLEMLCDRTSYFDTDKDFEVLKSSMWKPADSSMPKVRHAAASCLASTLTKSFTEDAPQKNSLRAKKSKKPSKSQQAKVGEADEDDARPRSSSAKREASKLQFSFVDMLRQLSSQYTKTATTNRARTTIAHCYMQVFRRLSSKTIESYFGQIVTHLFNELLSSPSIVHHRYRLLTSRKFSQVILNHCVESSVTGETGRINAARLLINDVLKDYPQVIKERPEPSKQALVGAIDALASLVRPLGSAFAFLGDSCREALIQVLQHPSYSVQIHACHCLRAFVLACPQQILPCASICMNTLNRELNLLATGRHVVQKCVGLANGVAAVIGATPSRPLYSSLEVCSRVLAMANNLLKSSSKTELRVAGAQVQVAWILIGGLMALGPNFVKVHISQFLLLWRNALPRPLASENTGKRKIAELFYLTHVRECTLGSILSFLEQNPRLVTFDVSKRIAGMLQNTIEFLQTLPPKMEFDDPTEQPGSSPRIDELVLMVRRRLLQCYTRLLSFNTSASGEILTQSQLLTFAVTCFADPDSYAPGSLGSSIANSAGGFENIWDVADNAGFGLTGLVRSLDIRPLPNEHINSEMLDHHRERMLDHSIDETVSHWH